MRPSASAGVLFDVRFVELSCFGGGAMEGPLRPEDGARFIAAIAYLEDSYRASFYLRLDNPGEVLTQTGDKRLFATEDEARRWLHAQAEARGFSSIEIECD
jgi:hypothetical protein